MILEVAEISHEPVNNNALDTEIECPSCHCIMTLYSMYDAPYFGCDDCNFCLYI